jgi:hypothetical protein
MAKLVTEIKILDSNECITFFELIADNLDCISEPLRSSIVNWVDSENKGWVSWTDIAPEYIRNDDCLVLLDGEDVSNVTGYNKILKKVSVINDNKRNVIKAASFSIKNIGFDNFVEWE